MGLPEPVWSELASVSWTVERVVAVRRGGGTLLRPLSADVAPT